MDVHENPPKGLNCDIILVCAYFLRIYKMEKRTSVNP